MSQEDSVLLYFYAKNFSSNWHHFSGDMQVLTVLGFAYTQMIYKN